MRHFRGSLIITILGLLLAVYIDGLSALYIVALLAVLEISLSFDNAVVNAKILETMEVKWQKRFITWGMPIAVFGMRFLFPIIIVAIASGLGLGATFELAINNHEKYHQTLIDCERIIFAFGASFLLMVFLDFLFDTEREHKWLHIIENNPFIHKMGKLANIQIIISLAIGLTLVNTTGEYRIALAYFTGLILHSMIASLDDFFHTNGVRNGLMGLLYLEVLDASFSFDGVIGAFALSDDIFVIMIGLAIGAMFVRSLTLYMLEKKTLTEYRYLEHGANYAILALASIMLLKIFIHVPEVIIGTIGVTFIGFAIHHSIQANKKQKKED